MDATQKSSKQPLKKSSKQPSVQSPIQTSAQAISTTDIVGDIYEASYQPQHWPVVLERICTLTQSDSAALLSIDRELQQANGLYTWNIDPALQAEYQSLKHDPNFELFLQNLAIGEASTADTIQPNRQALEAFYGAPFTDFCQRWDIAHTGGVILFHDDIRSTSLAIQRKSHRGHWPRTLITELDVLTPHLQRALNIHQTFVRLQWQEQVIREGLDNLVTGLILVNSDMQPVYLNPLAQHLIDEHPAFGCQNNRLFAVMPADNEALQNAVAKASQAPIQNDNTHHAITALGIHHPKINTPLPMLVTPITTAQPNGTHTGAAQAAIYVSDPQQHQPIVPESLCSAYDLSPKEAEIAIAIANGLALEAIAITNNTSVNTLKTHLKSIFRKLNIHRQAELVKIVMTGPFRVNFPDS